jgi:hypothetical protein
MSKAKSGTVIPAADVQRHKQQLAGCEARIETGLKSFADVGAALAEIRDAQLYRLEFGSFEEYAEARWELSRKRAYDQVAAAAVVSQICDKKRSDLPPPAIESHAAALVKVPEDRRAQVWEKVIATTGGKPTAKAVAEAWAALKPPADPHKDLREQMSGKPKQGKKPSVPAGEPVIDRNPGEDGTSPNANHGSHLPDPEPAPQVQEAVTEGKPHVCRFACRCGKTDTAFSEQAGALMDDRDRWQARALKAEAEVARRSAALDGHGQADPGTVPDVEPEAADSAHGEPELDADRNPMPDYEADPDPWDDGEFADLFEPRRRGR